MRFGTTARVVSAILVTALIPLVSALFVSRAIIARVSATAFQPEFGAHLDQALSVYADLAKSVKQGMRAEADAIAVREPLAVASRQPGLTLDRELARVLAAHPSLRQIRIERCNGVADGERERPVDAATERTLTVHRALGDDANANDPLCDDAGPRILVATFATPRARFDELEAAQTFAQAYHQIERDHREDWLDHTYRNAFAALLVATVLLAAFAGVLVARPVTRRIARLAAVTRPVAEGDLSVRVGIEGTDEIGDLGRAFDRMLAELERSRARVEFLKRMSEWQQVARRLAHEIKNPLTPIQLAVEECHRRYTGDDPAYRRIVETMYEVVEEEVGSLRRLVGEFSSFARLPRAELAPGDLAAFLREQEARFASDDAAIFGGLDLAFEVPAAPMPAAIDREMLHRVLVNVIRNAAQAASSSGQKRGVVRVTARVEADRYEILVDDDGPGIPPAIKDALFDPYVTTKRDGAGLGLSIVKKIVVDHGGAIEAGPSPFGGARFSITIPRPGTPEARAALEQRDADAPAPPSSARR